MFNPNLHLQRVVVVALCCMPGLAMADWLSTLQTWGTNIRLGLYLLGGTLALCCLMWSGITWLIARSQGDRSHTFMDYLQQVGVTMVVGSTMVLGAAAWQVFGTGTPA